MAELRHRSVAEARTEATSPPGPSSDVTAVTGQHTHGPTNSSSTDTARTQPPRDEGLTRQSHCRICYDDTPPLLHSLCGCKNSAGYVHRACLEQWLTTKTSISVRQGRPVDSRFRCEICQQEYSFNTRNITEYTGLQEHFNTFKNLIISDVRHGVGIPQLPDWPSIRVLYTAVGVVSVVCGGIMPFTLLPSDWWFPFFCMHECIRQTCLACMQYFPHNPYTWLVSTDKTRLAWAIFSVTVGPSLANLIVSQLMAVVLFFMFRLSWLDVACIISTQIFPFILLHTRGQLERFVKTFQAAGERQTTRIMPRVHNLGVRLADMEQLRAATAAGFKLEGPLSEATGLVLLNVLQGGAAHLAGLLPGDVIVSINGTSLSTTAEFKKMHHNLGDTWVVNRRGEELSLRLPTLQQD